MYAHICLSQQTYSILRIWSCLPYRAKLVNSLEFAHISIQSKLNQSLDFDNICLSEQTDSILRILSYLVYRESIPILQSLNIFPIQINLDQKFGFLLYLLIWSNMFNTNKLITFTIDQTCSILRSCQQLSAYLKFINTVSFITFAGPSKHFKSTLLSTFATFCKLAGNNKFACFHMGSKCCAKKQICPVICLICKQASKKTICIRICSMGNCIENS